MKNFKELGVKTEVQHFIGTKVDMFSVFNQEIVVHDFKVVDSKYEKTYDKCLHLQISMGTSMHVLFSGSRHLIETIESISREDLPFKTTIVRLQDKRHVFT